MKTFPVGLSDEARAEYQAAADRAGVSLAQWIRDACDTRLGRTVKPAPGTQARPSSLAGEFKGPDPKPSERRKKEG